MRPSVAFSFCLAGSALFFANGPRLLAVVYGAALVGGVTAWIALSTHIFTGEPLIDLIQMPSGTAAIFLLINAGVLLLRSDEGPMALTVSPGPGGKTVRRLVPAALFWPIVSGWLVGPRRATGGVVSI
jgi:hypothetical protein